MPKPFYKRPPIAPARPVLPNSAPHILKPIAVEGGALQVVWLPELDAHGLFFKREGDATVLATHNNGYSCHALAERLVKGDWTRIVQQADYIRDCGGMAIGTRFLERFLPPLDPCPVPTDKQQSLTIKCAHCGRLIDFRYGEVFKNGPSYVCRPHAAS